MSLLLFLEEPSHRNDFFFVKVGFQVSDVSPADFFRDQRKREKEDLDRSKFSENLILLSGSANHESLVKNENVWGKVL